ncbi:hypothetical protein Cni_G08183 [Canna indica]|uniref:Uncharacterized protein n=1 Tax=Canna indica TaxID=4628 RepID=A0AAQ3K0F7_9LILI|nr:hypothetical protein Cni_G08183 [Canna indica]
MEETFLLQSGHEADQNRIMEIPRGGGKHGSIVPFIREPEDGSNGANLVKTMIKEIDDGEHDSSICVEEEHEQVEHHTSVQIPHHLGGHSGAKLRVAVKSINFTRRLKVKVKARRSRKTKIKWSMAIIVLVVCGIVICSVITCTKSGKCDETMKSFWKLLCALGLCV